MNEEFIGFGIDVQHIDNIYRCVGNDDAKFLAEKLKNDIEKLEKWLKQHPKLDEKEKKKTELQIEWLKKLKLWKLKNTPEWEKWINE